MKVLLRVIGYLGVLLIVVAAFNHFGWSGGMVTMGTLLIVITLIEAVIWNDHIMELKRKEALRKELAKKRN